jgi:hypothetical protein
VFLHLPADGWPQIIDAEPTLSHISDLLGGVTVITTSLSDGGLGMAFTEDMGDKPLNLAASAIATFTENTVVPIGGPAVVTGIDVRAVDLTTGTIAGDVTGMEAPYAHALADIAGDMLYAEKFADDCFSGDLDEAAREKYGDVMRKMIFHIKQRWDSRSDSFGKIPDTLANMPCKYDPAEEATSATEPRFTV